MTNERNKAAENAKALICGSESLQVDFIAKSRRLALFAIPCLAMLALSESEAMYNSNYSNNRQGQPYSQSDRSRQNWKDGNGQLTNGSSHAYGDRSMRDPYGSSYDSEENSNYKSNQYGSYDNDSRDGRYTTSNDLRYGPHGGNKGNRRPGDRRHRPNARGDAKQSTAYYPPNQQQFQRSSSQPKLGF